MKKNYLYLIILLIATVGLTFLLSSIYNKEVNSVSYAYENLNKITSAEFEEYIIENTEIIIYVSNKDNFINNKFEKKFVNKLENLNLLENTIYIENDDLNSKFKELLKTNYDYALNEQEIPVIIVVDNGKVVDSVVVEKKSDVEKIINYEVFE